MVGCTAAGNMEVVSPVDCMVVGNRAAHTAAHTAAGCMEEERGADRTDSLRLVGRMETAGTVRGIW